MSVPFFIYSQNINSMFKSNFNVVENAVWIQDDSDTPNDINATSSVTSGTSQQQSENTYIQFTSRGSQTTTSQTYYTIMFNFPLRKNGKVGSGCQNTGGTVFGDAYYHYNLWTIVCTFTSNNMGVNSRLRIYSFYSPWFYLNSNEQIMTTYMKYYGSGYFSTNKATLGAGYPN